MTSFFFHFLLLPFRYMFGLSVIPALLQFLGFLFLPESPRWLIQRGLTQKARRVLSQIRGNQNIDEEYDSIKNSIEEEEKDSGGGEWKESQDMCEKGDLTVFCVSSKLKHHKICAVSLQFLPAQTKNKKL